MINDVSLRACECLCEFDCVCVRVYVCVSEEGPVVCRTGNTNAV